MISMSCVLLTVLLNIYCYRYQENKDIRKNMIFQIDTTACFFKALVFTVWAVCCCISAWLYFAETVSPFLCMPWCYFRGPTGCPHQSNYLNQGYMSHTADRLITVCCYRCCVYFQCHDQIIRQQFCTCYDSVIVVTGAKLWPDLIFVFHKRTTHIFTTVAIWAHRPSGKWILCPNSGFPSTRLQVLLMMIISQYTGEYLHTCRSPKICFENVC